MAKKLKQAASQQDDAMIPIQYVGQKPDEDDPVAGSGLRWQSGQILPVTAEQAAKLLFYPSMFRDARSAEAIAASPITTAGPADMRYEEADQIELERDPMPLVDVKVLTKAGLVHFAGMHLGKRLDVNDTLPKLRDQVNTAIEGQRFQWQ